LYVTGTDAAVGGRPVVGERQAMPDLIVVIPGITGSVLATDDGDVWALSGRAIATGLLPPGRSLRRLKLREGIGDEEPDDGLRATALMSDLHLLPGVWSPIKGYPLLLEELRRRFTISGDGAGQPTNLLAFPYDWRLSNVASARRLRDAVVPSLDRWRQRTRNPDAELVLVCHSMGGLVARWFLEVLGGWELTRWLVTIGTPFQGAPKALGALTNGVSKGWGAFKVDLTEAVRSFPSTYQLLPTYDCLDVGDGGGLRHLTTAPVPDLQTDMVRRAAEFHATIAERARQRPADAYRTLAIKGVRQPTFQSARLTHDGVALVREYGGLDRGGDGTVPRPSAHPPEWPDEYAGNTVAAAQRHSTLQETEEVFVQLFSVLSSGRLGGWLGGEQIGIEVPELLAAGTPLVVEATAKEDDLGLLAAVADEEGRPVGPPALLDPLGDGRYQAELEPLGPGVFQITVSSAVPTRQVDPVADVVVVYQPPA
jgi:hypothetical protein